MLRRTICPALGVLIAAAVVAVTTSTAAGGERPAGAHAGPPYDFTTELMGKPGTAEPLKNTAVIDKTKHGYQFRSGQQNSHLLVTLVNGGLRFADTGTESFKSLSAACRRKTPTRGVAAVCRVPTTHSKRSPLLVEVWPRLGNDYTDASTLPPAFAVTMLGDKGKDEAHFGAGPDFFNGFTGNDVVRGGAGNDWIRVGTGDDTVRSGPGNDDVVAKEGRDSIRGGNGRDRLWAGDGNDRLRGDDGADYLLCGNGRDKAKTHAADRVITDCESVKRH